MWQHLATLPGGTVAGLVEADGRVFAATPAGIRSSADGGRTWSIAGHTSPVPFATVIAASPDGRVLFSGGREGAYRSTDAGATWQHVLSGGNVLALAVPSAELVFAGTEADGVLRSDDGGRSWSGANPGLLDLTILALVLSPHFEQDRLAFAATASGVYRTRNGGRSWRGVDLPGDDLAVQALAISPRFAADHLVLAGTEADGALRSTDAGDTWDTLDGLAGQGVTALAFAAPGTLAAATEGGVALSDDGGLTWQLGVDQPGPVLSLAWLHDGALLAGLARYGVARSTDRGATWASSPAGLRARLLIGLTATSRALVAGDLEAGLVVSHDAGSTWQERDAPAVHGLTATPEGTLFAATEGGLLRSADDGATWLAVPPPSSEAVRAVAYGQCLLVALADQSLHASDDAGATWRSLATPFGSASIVALAATPDGTIFVATSGTGDVVVWRSTGKTWQRWLVEPGAADLLPMAVSPGHAIDGGLFVGLGGHVLRPSRTADEVRAGERRPIWQRSALGSGALRITALLVRERTVLAATSAGVFVSRDAGASFAAFSEGLTPAAVVSLAYPEGGQLYALGLGGTVWRRSSL